jgi:hypothetical protein
MKKTDPTAMSNKYLMLITPLPKKMASILTQMRTGHVPLAKHLHRIGKADLPICPTCQQHKETIEHLLLHCPAHQDTRQALHSKVEGRNIVIAKLLTMPKTLRLLFRFVTATGCFHNTFGEVPTPQEEGRRG